MNLIVPARRGVLRCLTGIIAAPAVIKIDFVQLLRKGHFQGP